MPGEAGYRLQHGGLAGAAFADQRKAFAVADAEADAVGDPGLAVGDIEIGDVSYGRSRITHGIGFSVATAKVLHWSARAGPRGGVLKAIAGLARQSSGSISVLGGVRAHGIDRRFCQAVPDGVPGPLRLAASAPQNDATLSEPLAIAAWAKPGQAGRGYHAGGQPRPQIPVPFSAPGFPAASASASPSPGR